MYRRNNRRFIQAVSYSVPVLLTMAVLVGLVALGVLWGTGALAHG